MTPSVAKPKTDKKVMLFGVFDGIHEGHRSLFAEARRHGGFLIVAAAQDDIVRQLKGRPPRSDLARRLADLGDEPSVDMAVPGDKALGRWDVVARHEPDIIVLGYDQGAMRESIVRYARSLVHKPKIFVAKAYRPETHHSSTLFPREGIK